MRGHGNLSLTYPGIAFMVSSSQSDQGGGLFLETDRPILGQFGAETTVILMHSDTSGNFWKRLDTF